MRIKVLLALVGLALALLFAVGCSDSGNSTNIQRFGTITGTVEDFTQGCAPVIGATVQLFQGENLIAEATTDETGTFTFENVPFGAYTLVVSGEGFESTSIPVTVSTEEAVVVPVTVNTTVPNVGAITGTVQDAALENAPVVGATVQLIQGETVVAETLTDETGAFTLDNVPFGTYTLVVTGTGFEPTSTIVMLADVTVFVPVTVNATGVTVSGSVTGDLIAGDTVTLTLIPDGAATGDIVTSTVVEVDGAPTAPFTFSNVAANSYTIEVTDTTFAPTFFGPFQVTTSAISGLTIPVVSETFLSDSGVPAPAPGTATVVILPPIDQPAATVTFTVNGIASTVSTGGFAYVPDITAATEPVVATVTLDGNTFDVSFIPLSDRIIAIQLAPLM